MLSILIPVFNADVRSLVRNLHAQACRLQIDFEIIVSDDASTCSECQCGNAQLSAMAGVVYVANAENQGRSRIRNQLMARARFPYLVMMDCDANVCDEHFLERYVSYVRQCDADGQPFVVLGGVAYRRTPPDKTRMLRWKYGINREERPAIERNRNPYHAFTPFNMLLTKSVNEYCQFDESLVGYGFEDTLYGEQLREKGIHLEHIDNPLFHDGLNTNAEFVRNIENAVANLKRLYQEGRLPESFIRNSKLLSTCLRCQHYRLLPLVRGILRIHRRCLYRMMVRHHSVHAIDLYKLLLLSK